MTSLSRVLGLVREMLQSRLIGAGWEQSAFALAFAIPNMARKLFGEGALTAAFVPVFKGEVAAENLDGARRLARAVMTMALLMLGAGVVLGVIGISAALSFHPWGLSPSAEGCRRAELVLQTTRILLPYMLFICGAAFGMGILNAMGRFAAAAFMPCLLNVFWIAALAWLVFAGEMPVALRVQRVAAAILTAGAVQMAFMFWCLHRRGMTPRLSFQGWGDEKTRRVWKNTAVAAMGAGAVQINYMLDQVLGQMASPWAAGVIGYADRLMDLPLGVIGVAFGTVLLPTFAGCFAQADHDGARRTFVTATDKMLALMIPAAAGLGLLAPEVTRVIYEGRAFDGVATVRVARAVACYAAGLAFFGLQKSLVPWFQAQHDMKTPLAVSVKMVFLNAFLNVAAVVTLPEEWRHVGLAGSTVLCAAGSCWLLGTRARRTDKGALRFAPLAGPVGATCLATGVMGAALWFLRPAVHAWSRDVIGSEACRAMITLGVLMAAGAAVYFAVRLPLARLKPRAAA